MDGLRQQDAERPPPLNARLKFFDRSSETYERTKRELIVLIYPTHDGSEGNSDLISQGWGPMREWAAGSEL